MSGYRWVRHEGTRLADVGVHADGTLHNPNGYPEALVRVAVAAADARRHVRRVQGAQKAVATRYRRRVTRVDALAKRLAAGTYGPSKRCGVCGRALDDPDSVRRGIGPECWQDVLTALETIRTVKACSNGVQKAV